MFEHLDDPNFTGPEPGLKAKVTRSAQLRRRRQRTTAVTALVVPLLGIAGGSMFLRRQATELETVSVGGLASSETTVSPEAKSSDPVTILVVGSDRRSAGEDGFGDVDGSRSDATMLVRIDPDAQHVGVLAIPGSLVVPTPTGEQRVATIGGNPTELVTALDSYLGVPIDHYVEIEFAGFRRLIDLAGGVPINFDAPYRDLMSGLATDAGCVVLDGDQALAYVRSRQLERFDASTSTWTADESGGAGVTSRTDRQLAFTVIVAGHVLAAEYGVRDEVELLTDVIDSVTVDAALNVQDLREIFDSVRRIGPANVHGVALATRDSTLDEIPVLAADPRDVADAVDRLLGTSAAQDAPTEPAEDSVNQDCTP